MTNTMRRTTASVLMALAPVAFLMTWVFTRDDIGSRIATHFRASGHPDGFSGTSGFVLGMGIACVAVVLVGVAVVAFGRTVARPFAGAVAFAAWVLSTSGIAILLAARDVAPADARSGWVAMIVSVVVAAVLGLATARMLPPTSAAHTVAGAEPAYRLAPGERASWFGSARSQVLLVIGLVALVVGVVVFVLGNAFGVIIAVVGLIGIWTHSLTVRVDAAGVTAHFGPIAWPRVRVPLARIEAVQAQRIEPMQWGGWGYRIARRGTALVVRRGPGLVIARTGGSDMAITVDDPEGAADLINALLARESAGEPS